MITKRGMSAKNARNPNPESEIKPGKANEKKHAVLIRTTISTT
jgi:hypothetical protein